MSWFSGKVSLGNFPDFSDAVTKFSESVKNIEKNFDNALGFEEKAALESGEASGASPSSSDVKDAADPDVEFSGSKNEENEKEPLENPESPKPHSSSDEKGVEIESSVLPASEQTSLGEEIHEVGIKSHIHPDLGVGTDNASSKDTEVIASNPGNAETDVDSQSVPVGISEESNVEHVKESDSLNCLQQKISETVATENSESTEAKPSSDVDGDGREITGPHELSNSIYQTEIADDDKTQEKDVENAYPLQAKETSNDTQIESGPEPPGSDSPTSDESKSAEKISDRQLPHAEPSEDASDMVPVMVSHEHDAIARTMETLQQDGDHASNKSERLGSNSSDAEVLRTELEKVKKDMQIMENALQCAARQAQAKADEIAKMMNENEKLNAALEDARRKSNEAEVESLREEYHQRVSSLERKVYALTKERDTLRREQSKKSDAAALLKEKDEIINQVMAEGEELSKKQATQESLIRKLRAQVEENKVESIKRYKAATEKFLQETIEKHQVELGSQKEYYTNALTAAKEAEALAEARANNEARTEVESRLREAEERETMLVQALEELRQTLSRKEQQVAFREDMLRKEMEDLQKRYQASERRCEELVTQVPESTRPLLRQIEAMQETTSRRAEAWAAVERSLNSRLQEAEGRAAEAEERERSVNERLSQTLSRINDLEAQCDKIMNRGHGRGRNQSPRSFHRPGGRFSPSTHTNKPAQDGKDNKSHIHQHASGESSTDRFPMQSDEAVPLGSTSSRFERLKLVTDQPVEVLNSSKHLDGLPGSKFASNNPNWGESELLQPPSTATAAISPKEVTKCRESYGEKTVGVGRSEKPFDICVVKTGIPKLKPPLHAHNREKRKEMKRSMGEQVAGTSILRPGMVLLRNFISCSEQVKIVQTCRKLGLGKGGFYQPGYDNGARMHLNMMCLGLDWDPNTSLYTERRAVDGAEPPPVPSEFHQLVQKAIQDARAYILNKTKLNNVESILPSMTPDICIVNFYTSNGKLGLHQDKDESQVSLERGLPVVSISIGDSAQFLYGDERDEDKAEKVILESGDVLIFGGKSRHVYHGVTSITPDTAPPPLLQGSDIRPGRLNLTFRKY